MSTNGATFYITGVQLEVGSSATGFEYRPFTTELQLCQRYYQKSFNQGQVPTNSGLSSTTYTNWTLSNPGGGSYANSWVFPVIMRTTPTITFYNPISPTGTAAYWHCYISAGTGSDQLFAVNGVTDSKFDAYTNSNAQVFAYGEFTASAEL